MERIELSVLPAEEADADAEELDRSARDLLADIRDLPVESAEFVSSGPAPAGTKGLEMAAGEIMVLISTASVKVLVDFLMAKRARIRFEGPVAGKPIKFEGTAKEFARLMSMIGDPSPTDNP
jgi:hypothetical protein